MGMSMFDTHDPVPDFNKQLLKSVERTFTRIAPDQPFEREAVFVRSTHVNIVFIELKSTWVIVVNRY